MPFGSLPGRALSAFGGYLRRHPEEVLRAAKNAASLKLGVPVQALLWLARELGGNKVPADLELEARNPGIFARASFEMMKTPLRGGANIIVEAIDMRSDAILIDLRVEDIALEVTRPNVGTPVAALLQSGALDLSRPGDLLSYMPERPDMLVEARGNVITLDLMKHPKLSAERARKLVALIVPLVGVEAIRTEGRHLDVAFAPLPGGPAEVFEQFRKLF
jgi:hypothetical protein